ncbi:unnamed protein product [Prorocentrum cordatum]|uniref:Decapping nuclease n=1 Tax=Prorocentrum cordatum TaxID=2364126 RepID=A0ABN9VGG2_9DINO|nr:unnamed protein product [Polarella glacialis]
MAFEVAISLRSGRSFFLAPQGVRHLILQASSFSNILQASNANTSDVFAGAPLSTITPSLRGDVIAEVARQVDAEVNPRSIFERGVLGNCCNGSRRGPNIMEYDWLRDGLRVECKSSKMSWVPSRKSWEFAFYHIKIAHGEARRVAAFDELLLVLYTPTHLYFYRHWGTFGLRSAGRLTSTVGHQLRISSGGGIEDWRLALKHVLGKLDDGANSCERLSIMPLADNRIQHALDSRCNVTQKIFNGCPLFEVTPATRGKRLEVLTRRVDRIVNPCAEMKWPDSGYCVGGLQRRGVHRAVCDWHRDDIRVECKSSQLQWDKHRKRWLFQFQNVKFSIPPSFDELLLAFYTPRGVYIYRHDLRFGISSCGVATSVRGHRIGVYGPCQEADWQVALDTMINKIGESGCDRVAFVRW